MTLTATATKGYTETLKAILKNASSNAFIDNRLEEVFLDNRGRLAFVGVYSLFHIISSFALDGSGPKDDRGIGSSGC